MTTQAAFQSRPSKHKNEVNTAPAALRADSKARGGGKAHGASYVTGLSCNCLLPVPNVMSLHAADNKHNYHTIYKQVPLGGRATARSLRLRITGAELTLEGLP